MAYFRKHVYPHVSNVSLYNKLRAVTAVTHWIKHMELYSENTGSIRNDFGEMGNFVSRIYEKTGRKRYDERRVLFWLLPHRIIRSISGACRRLENHKWIVYGCQERSSVDVPQRAKQSIAVRLCLMSFWLLCYPTKRLVMNTCSKLFG